MVGAFPRIGSEEVVTSTGTLPSAASVEAAVASEVRAGHPFHSPLLLYIFLRRATLLPNYSNSHRSPSKFKKVPRQLTQSSTIGITSAYICTCVLVRRLTFNFHCRLLNRQSERHAFLQALACFLALSTALLSGTCFVMVNARQCLRSLGGSLSLAPS